MSYAEVSKKTKRNTHAPSRAFTDQRILKSNRLLKLENRRWISMRADADCFRTLYKELRKRFIREKFLSISRKYFTIPAEKLSYYSKYPEAVESKRPEDGETETVADTNQSRKQKCALVK